MTHSASRPRIVLGVTGSIAAFKAPLILRMLQKAGYELDVVLTQSAAKFVGESTYRGLGAHLGTSMWETDGELHVSLAASAQLLLIAPATADILARLAQGRADDLLTATALCYRGRVLVAPAMHPAMYAAAPTQENLRKLRERGYEFVGPVVGEVASGDVGLGRMDEPEKIVQRALELLESPRLLAGKHVVVTSGPTSEAIDPVRCLTNISSGKMGYAIAEALLRAGAQVTLLSGPSQLTPPAGAKLIPFGSALDLQAQLDAVLGRDLSGADALVMAAAVSDYRPAAPSSEKHKRSAEPWKLELVPNPDVLKGLAARRTGAGPKLVGFALETAEGEKLIELGRLKLKNKGVDLIVANSAQSSLGRDDNRVTLVSETEAVELPALPKSDLATRLVEWLAAQF